MFRWMTSWDDLWHRNQTFFAAFVAAIIAIWVMLVNVEIDATIQTLILTLSPIIVAYWWPEASRPEATDPNTHRDTRTTSRKSDWGLDPDVAVALAVALFLYVGVQAWLAFGAGPDLQDADLTVTPWWAKILMGVLPVFVGAITSPDQS
jgi:hypothetical protein